SQTTIAVSACSTGASSGTPAGLKHSRLSSFERAPCAPEPRFGRRAVYSSRAQRSVWKNQQSHAKIHCQAPLRWLATFATLRLLREIFSIAFETSARSTQG